MTERIANGQALEICFAAIERAACEGARCPENGALGMESRYVTQLAVAGRIKVEISGHSYRAVTILAGPNAGKRTRPDPLGGKPYRIIDHRGSLQTRTGFPSVRPTRKQAVSLHPVHMP